MIQDSNDRDSLSSDEADLPDDPRIAEVVADYQREFEMGHQPHRQQFINRYPELAEAVEECLDGLRLLFQGAPKVKSHNRVSNFAGQLNDRNPPHVLGDFKIVRELARGGMGVVYEALQLSLGRRVALKVLPFAATLDTRQLQRFKNEAQAAALLHHTNIVPIYAVGCERGVHFYAMQLIEGQSLATVIRELRVQSGRNSKRLTGSSANDSDPTAAWPNLVEPQSSSETVSDCRVADDSTTTVTATLTNGLTVDSENYFRRISGLFIQAAQALDHAHELGIVHRDIKPANLLIDSRGGLWVTDFGLAQLQSDHGLTYSGDLVGTLRYMSPEQASGQRATIDNRSDIYSLGATFYELLTLEPVFSSDSHQELLYQILNTDPHAPRHWNPSIPAELETIVLKALSKNSVDRYCTAAELAADLQRFLDHQPILARRPSLLDRMRKWTRRHPSIAIAGALLSLVITAGSLLSMQLLAHEQRKTADALDREKIRANEAEQQFLLAKQAVDTLFEISEEELNHPPMDGARKRILQVVLSHYQDFIKQRQGNLASQSELAVAQNKVKSILHELTVLQRDMHTRLLMNEAVQADLKVKPEQITRLNVLLSEWSEDRRESMKSLQTLNDADRRKRMVADAEQREHELADVLNAAQLQRFKQIGIQSLGLRAFQEPEVAQRLKLSVEQRSEIRTIERDFLVRHISPDRPFQMDGPQLPLVPRDPSNRIGGGFQIAQRPDEKPGHRADLSTQRKEAVEEALSLLNSRQLEQWHELTGEPFADFGNEPFLEPRRMPPRP